MHFLAAATDQVKKVLANMSQHAGKRGSQEVVDTGGPSRVPSVSFKVIDILSQDHTQHLTNQLSMIIYLHYF